MLARLKILFESGFECVKYEIQYNEFLTAEENISKILIVDDNRWRFCLIRLLIAL